MNDRFESLESGEVISVQHDTQVLIGHRTFRVGELNDAIKDRLEQAISGWTEDKNDWFNAQGIDCEALRFGSNGWQKGRIRLCLEFCPDDANLSTQTERDRSIPTLAVVSSQNTHSITENTAIRSENTPTVETSDLPVVGIAAGVMTAGAAAIALEMPIALEQPVVDNPITPDLAIALEQPVVDNVITPDLATVSAVSPPVGNSIAPNLTDAVLELEEHPIAASADVHENMEEISFDFDLNNDSLGTKVPNGAMELDLTDLDLDGAEQDYLNFETNGMPDSPQELADLHDINRSENSGMLIDEVWNEMSQPNWPGIH